MLHTTLAAAATTAVEPGPGITQQPQTGFTTKGTSDSWNPFDGLKPDFNWLGDHFTQQWQMALAGLWGLVILASAFFLLLAILKMRHLKDAKMPQKAEAAKGKVIGTAVMTGSAIIVPAIFGFIINAVGGN